MELTIEQALQQGLAAHKEGKIEEAERIYRTILNAQPAHPDANHNLGVIAVSVNNAGAALPLFKNALDANPNIEQFWLSYIDGLIKENQLKTAKTVLAEARKMKIVGEKIEALEEQLKQISNSPSQKQLNILLEHFQNQRYDESEKLAESITKKFPTHQFSWKILGAVLGMQSNRLSEAVNANQRAVQLAPEDGEAHNNLGNTLQELGRLEEAEKCFKQSIAVKPDFAIAHNNLGITLQDLGRLEEAAINFTQATTLKPDFSEAFWNLTGTVKTVTEAEHFLDKCLMADASHVAAKLTKAALRFYQGDKAAFDGLMKSKFNDHPLTRSFSWAFSLPHLPELHFNKWSFFDSIVKKSITSRPYYEFGVWRGAAFKYLIKSFKKGYGFDTFSGLPEDWNLGDTLEKAGFYTSDGKVPDIEGGEFIVGKFEDTLPIFFSEDRPMASVINFDADLYSSTICALNFSKLVIDKDSILIFDEFIVNESWEQDEFKALNDFCSVNHCTYEVLAISFFTKQVAVKLINI